MSNEASEGSTGEHIIIRHGMRETRSISTTTHIDKSHGQKSGCRAIGQRLNSIRLGRTSQGNERIFTLLTVDSVIINKRWEAEGVFVN